MQLFVFFAGHNLVERFELIATTGKNAKMPLIPFLQLSNPSAICYLKRLRAKARPIVSCCHGLKAVVRKSDRFAALFIEIIRLRVNHQVYSLVFEFLSLD